MIYIFSDDRRSRIAKNAIIIFVALICGLLALLRDWTLFEQARKIGVIGGEYIPWVWNIK